MCCQFHDKRLVNDFEDQLDKTIKTGYKETQKNDQSQCQTGKTRLILAQNRNWSRAYQHKRK